MICSYAYGIMIHIKEINVNLYGGVAYEKKTDISCYCYYYDGFSRTCVIPCRLIHSACQSR